MADVRARAGDRDRTGLTISDSRYVPGLCYMASIICVNLNTVSMRFEQMLEHNLRGGS